MSYLRVIPRDLFNEASLLKCYGRIAILLDGNERAGFETIHEYQGDAFDIVQSDDDGSITVWNLPLIIGGTGYRLWRPLNSREAWPLYLRNPNDDYFDEIEVFDAAGNFTADMLALLNA